MKVSNKAYSVDANVILRYLLHDIEEQWVRADALMRAMEVGEVQLLCDPVNLAEVVWILMSSYGLERERIATILEPLLQTECFIVPDKDRYVRALELYRTTVADFGDACACAAALRSCAGKLQSFDRKLSRIDGISRHEGLAHDVPDDREHRGPH